MFDPKAHVVGNGVPDRIEGKWEKDISWYGGGLKVCQYHGHTLVLFAFCDWRWEASSDLPIGVLPANPNYVSGIVLLQDWQDWSASFRTKRRSQPEFLLHCLSLLALDGTIHHRPTLAQARRVVTTQFRALTPRSAIVGRTPASRLPADLLF